MPSTSVVRKNTNNLLFGLLFLALGVAAVLFESGNYWFYGTFVLAAVYLGMYFYNLLRPA